MRGRLVRDQSGASTELGYIFTFLLGVLFLSMFSVWSFGLETSTRENWNTTAVDINMADIAAAVERAAGVFLPQTTTALAIVGRARWYFRPTLRVVFILNETKVVRVATSIRAGPKSTAALLPFFLTRKG